MSNIVRIDKKKKNKIADDMLDYMQGFDFNEDWGIRKQPLSSDLKYYKSRVLANMYNFSLSANKFMKFFYASRLHFIIILEISIGEMKSFEFLCQKIPNPLGKRTTIQTILNESVDTNILLKYPSEKDKRIKFYKLSNDSERALNDWAKANIA